MLSFLKQPHKIRPVQVSAPSFPLTDSEAVNLRDYVMLAFRDDRVPKAAQIGPGRQPRSRSSGRTALLGKILLYLPPNPGETGGAAVGPDWTDAWGA